MSILQEAMAALKARVDHGPDPISVLHASWIRGELTRLQTLERVGRIGGPLPGHDDEET